MAIYGEGGCIEGIHGDHTMIAPWYYTDKKQINIIVKRHQKVLDIVFKNI
jgi:hypothetical protein